jgi:hypothetical protein
LYPEHAELRHERIRKEDVTASAVLRGLPPEAHPSTRRSVPEEHVPDVQAHELGQAEACAESK